MEARSNVIFLVDDNPIYLNAGKSLLQEIYTVVTIPSGEKLLQVLEKTKPALILLDVEMPGMNGYDTIKKVKANPETAEIPVIFLTGKGEPENELLGLSLGAVDYITKPFSLPLLLKRIELHLLLQFQNNELRKFNENLSVSIGQLQTAVIKWAAEMIEFRDEEIGRHVKRVRNYLEILLGAINKIERYAIQAAEWDREAFLNSALLHDIGIIKSGFAKEDYDNIKRHTLYGKKILESLQEKVPGQGFLDYAKTLAYGHHERWDGTGYPEGLKGESIPLQARMMILADAYDVLTSGITGEKTHTHEEAMKIILESRGTWFDPELTDLFVSLSPEIKQAGMAEI